MGGSEVLTMATALALDLLGHQVTVMIAEGTIHPSFTAQLQQQNIRFISLDVEGSLDKKLNTLQALLVQQSWDILHFIPVESLACAWVQHTTDTAHNNIPIVVTETTNASPSVWWMGKDEQYVLQNVQGVIAMSYQAASNIWRLRDKNKPLHVIPSFLPPQNRSWETFMSPIAETAFNHIGCISRLSEEKGLEFLLAAMAMLKAENSQITLHLYGDGQERYRVESLIRAFELENSVILHGYVEDIYEAIEQCSLFVLPSLLEGLPLSLLEIMASGRTFIATNVGGIPELVNDGDWAMLVEKGDSRALANAIKCIAYNREHLLHAGKKARAVYEKSWHSKLMAETIVKFYKDVLSRADL
ncbi:MULTISPECIES: glycosyltransferase family 4 protein [unclassified Moorena]|nr:MULTISPECIES: glycosyltransferase family 4 protein [unclassified Moorena]